MDIVTCENIEKRRGRFVLGPLSLTLRTGETIALVGANGSGKTTLLKVLAGLIRPSAGTIRYTGDGGRQKIGYLPDHVSMYEWMRGTEILHFVSRFYSDWDPVLCERLVQKLDVDVRKRFRELSYGMRVKLGLVCALAHRPRLLLLDEPLRGLDPLAKRDLLGLLEDFVKHNQCAIVISSHMLEEIAGIATRAILLRMGRIQADALMDAIRQNSGISRWFYAHHETSEASPVSVYPDAEGEEARG